jgi:general secretion pathway protein K
MNTGATAVRGAALLMVMWLIALLAALVGAFALTARMERLQERVLSRGLVAEQAARAGLEYALVRIALDDPRRQWRPDGRVYHWRYANADIEVRVIDELGKIDLNHADATLLAGLFRAAGSQRAEAEQLAAVILDFRDDDPLTQPAGGAEDPDYAAAGRQYGAKDTQFETVAEVEQVLGMTPAIYAKVAPHLTVYTGLTEPDTAYASAMVLTAMGLDGAAMVAAREAQDPSQGDTPSGFGMGGSGDGTYSIQSRARLPEGREAVVRGVVRLGASGVPGSAYTALDWQQGTMAR